MHVAHGEGAVPEGPGIDVRDCMGVTKDLHRHVEAGHGLLPSIGWQREPRARADNQRQRGARQGAERPVKRPGPAEPRCCRRHVRAKAAALITHLPRRSASGTGGSHLPVVVGPARDMSRDLITLAAIVPSPAPPRLRLTSNTSSATSETHDAGLCARERVTQACRYGPSQTSLWPRRASGSGLGHADDFHRGPEATD